MILDFSISALLPSYVSKFQAFIKTLGGHYQSQRQTFEGLKGKLEMFETLILKIERHPSFFKWKNTKREEATRVPL